MRKSIRFIHRWFGILIGLIVILQCITGCIYIFKDEINDLLKSDYLIVQKEGNTYQPPSKILQVIQTDYPYSTCRQINYIGPDRAVQVVLVDSIGTTKNAYVNPYNLSVLKDENSQDEFFQTVRNLHMYLGLPPKVGKPIVGAANVLFLLLIISGLYLFWPKTSADRKGAFSIKWGAKFKRLNYDLHRVLGTYLILFALILSITGMIFSFEVIKKTVFHVLNTGQGENSELFIKPNPADIDEIIPFDKAIDIAYKHVRNTSEQFPMVWISFPQSNSFYFRIRAYPHVLSFRQLDDYFFNLNANLIDSSIHKNASLGKKVINSIYDIHTGIIFGSLSKIVLFIASLTISSLPITGFIIWKSRERNRKPNFNNLNRIV